MLTFGSWWINPTFAFRDGIIDRYDASGGITYDKVKACAILLTEDDEVAGTSSERVTYRTRTQDKGRYRLTSATRDERGPIRLLRSHNLRSFWSPRAGVRYDGLYRVVGWNIHADRSTGTTIYNVNLERLPTEPPMDSVLERPLTHELEDYTTFKKMRQAARLSAIDKSKPTSVRSPTFLSTTDGASQLTSMLTFDTRSHL